MLCVALVIIMIAWSALCIATMIQCVVYERYERRERHPNQQSYECQESSDAVEMEVDVAVPIDIQTESENVISIELAVRAWGTVISIVIILAISSKYQC
jgi:hypothetical protein